MAFRAAAILPRSRCVPVAFLSLIIIHLAMIPPSQALAGDKGALYTGSMHPNIATATQVPLDAHQQQPSAQYGHGITPTASPPTHQQDARPTTARPSTRDPTAIRAAPRGPANPDTRPMTSNRVRLLNISTTLVGFTTPLFFPPLNREQGLPRGIAHEPPPLTPSAAVSTPARLPRAFRAEVTPPPWGLCWS